MGQSHIEENWCIIVGSPIMKLFRKARAKCKYKCIKYAICSNLHLFILSTHAWREIKVVDQINIYHDNMWAYNRQLSN